MNIPDHWIRLGSGLDSIVYRVDDHVAKIYPKQRYDVLRQYCDDTLRARDLIQASFEGILIHVIPQGSAGRIGDIPITLGQKFIPGMNLREMKNAGIDISEYIVAISGFESMLNSSMKKRFNIASCNVKPMKEKDDKVTGLIITDLVCYLGWTYR